MWEALFYSGVGGASVIIYRDVIRPWLMLKAGLRKRCDQCGFEITATKSGLARQVMVDHKRGHIV